MSMYKKYFFTYNLIFTLSFCAATVLHAQDTINVLVKVYDIQLTPISNIGFKIQDEVIVQTNSEGIAFVKLAESLLPPKLITISDQKLEVESWNYSKGMLEVIVREKNYKEITINLRAARDNLALPDIHVHVNLFQDTLLVSDSDGNITFALPNAIQINNPDLISIKGYRIARKTLDEQGGTLVIEEIKPQPKFITRKKAPPNIAEQIDITDDMQDLDLDHLDSITSLTVFYSLFTNINYYGLDAATQSRVDAKFQMLLAQNTQSLPSILNMQDLISDSSMITTDISVIIRKIQAEEKLLLDSRKQFEIATNQITEKLTDGGKHLSDEERNQLVELILNMRIMLRNNEELFFKNNSYYRGQLDSLINQVANIYELEDLLQESEETYSEVKEQLKYALLAFTSIIAITALLVYLIRILRSQKSELATANKEIVRINSSLEGLVAKKTISLELINKELDTFLYRSSHNLRRPLTSIRGLANIAKISLNDEGISLFEKVVLTIKNMENLLDKLAVMSHLNQPTDFSVIDFTQISDRLLLKFSNKIEEAGLIYNVNIPEDIEFKSYPYVVELILYNLLENAFFFCKFTRGYNPQVDLDIFQDDNDNLCMTVRDNGYGIDPKYHQKIWDMFFLANDQSQGNGLGLYITKKAVESLNGKITLDTFYGKYCQFNVLLPTTHLKSLQLQNTEALA